MRIWMLVWGVMLVACGGSTEGGACPDTSGESQRVCLGVYEYDPVRHCVRDHALTVSPCPNPRITSDDIGCHYNDCEGTIVRSSYSHRPQGPEWRRCSLEEYERASSAPACD